MICDKPFIKTGTGYGCGQCLPCRVNRQRIWTHRIMLEALCHKDCSFLTLSYDQNHLPLTGQNTGERLATLKPDDLKNWLKRYRKAMEPLRIRFYAVGEYGGRTLRPHYHVIVFGGTKCSRNRTKHDYATNGPDPLNCCDHCATVANSWGLGNIVSGEVNQTTAGYVAKYSLKAITKHDDDRLRGRHPEFSRMSLRPGIGADALHEVGHSLFTYAHPHDKDVPDGLRHGPKVYPFGRYLRGKLREVMGKDKKAPPETIAALEESVRPLREYAFETSQSLQKVLIEDKQQASLNMKAKLLINQKEKF